MKKETISIYFILTVHILPIIFYKISLLFFTNPALIIYQFINPILLFYVRLCIIYKNNDDAYISYN